MEKEKEMGLNAAQIGEQADGVELSEKALSDAASGIAGIPGFVCSRCRIFYSYSRPRIGKNGEELCRNCT